MSQRTCPTCHSPIVRRDKENDARFALRVFCDRRCFQRARRSGSIGAVRAAGSWPAAIGSAGKPLP